MAKHFVNVDNVSVGGKNLTLVQNVSFDRSGTELDSIGDDADYACNVHLTNRTHIVTIVVQDLGHGVTEGTRSSVSWRYKDKSGGSNHVTYTGNQGVVTGVSDSGGRDTNGETTITYKAFSADGVTAPISSS